MLDTPEEIEEFFKHAGVKGMKWGQRRALASNMRELDKKTRANDRVEKIKSIDAARNRLDSRAQSVQKAKAKYKKDRYVVGKVAAKKALAKSQDAYLKDFETASQYRDGKEAALYIVAGVAATALVSYLLS